MPASPRGPETLRPPPPVGESLEKWAPNELEKLLLLQLSEYLSFLVSRLSSEELEYFLNSPPVLKISTKHGTQPAEGSPSWPDDPRGVWGSKGVGLAKLAELSRLDPNFPQVPDAVCFPINLGEQLRKQTEGRYDWLDWFTKFRFEAGWQQLELMTTGDELFGDAEVPRPLAVRSGARESMPGMMVTVLNAGVSYDSEGSMNALVEKLGERGAWQTYTNFCLSFLQAVTGVEMKYLLEKFAGEDESSANGSHRSRQHPSSVEDAEYYRRQVKYLHNWARQEYGFNIPQDPRLQVLLSMLAVYRSYDSAGAFSYRREKLLDQEGQTGVILMPIVFGNQRPGDQDVGTELLRISGSGQAFSHHLETGKREMQVTFLPGDQGFGVVDDQSGSTLDYIPDLSHPDADGTPSDTDYSHRPDNRLTNQLRQALDKLVAEHSGAPVEVEFVVQQGQLYLLQFRLAKPSPAMRIELLLQQAPEPLYDQDGKPQSAEYHNWLRHQVDPGVIYDTLRTRFNEEQEQAALEKVKTGEIPDVRGHGIGGAFSGELVVLPAGGEDDFPAQQLALERIRMLVGQGKRVVLWSEVLDPNFLGKLMATGVDSSQVGVVTMRGNHGSHAANVARARGVSAVVGVGHRELEISIEQRTGTQATAALTIGTTTVPSGADVSINAQTGRVFVNTALETEQPQLDQPQQKFLSDVEAVHGRSPFKQLALALGLDEELDKDRRSLEKVTAQIDRPDGPTSTKAISQLLMNAVLEDTGYLHPYEVMSCRTQKDRKAIREVILKGLENNWDISLRSALTYPSNVGDAEPAESAGDVEPADTQFSVNPWIMFKPTGSPELDHQAVDAFFYGQASPDDLKKLAMWQHDPRLCKYGSLSSWQQQIDPTETGKKTGPKNKIELNEVLVGYDPKGKLDNELKKEHFVAALTMVPGPDQHLAVTVQDGTAQLRSLEEGNELHDPEQQIALKIGLGNRQPVSDSTQVSFGRAHHRPERIESLAYQMLQLDPREVVRSRLQAVGGQLVDPNWTGWNNGADQSGLPSLSGRQYPELDYSRVTGDEVLFHALLCQELGQYRQGKLASLGKQGVKLDEITEAITGMLEQGKVPVLIQEELVTDRAWALVDSFMEIILMDPGEMDGVDGMRNKLITAMAVLEEHYGTSLTLEFQGRLGEIFEQEELVQPLIWLKIYGSKGAEESERR